MSTLRKRLARLPLALLGFVLGTVLTGIAIAQTTSPTPIAKVREQNVDANGFIRVHEQGVLSTVATVDNFPSSFSISNFPTSFSINNLPETQNVRVSAATKGFTGVINAEANKVAELTLPTPINATTISVGKGTAEAGIWFRSSISLDGSGAAVGPSVFQVVDHDGKVPFVNHSFTQPVPISAIVVYCTNESQLCSIDVDIVGEPGSL